MHQHCTPLLSQEKSPELEDKKNTETDSLKLHLREHPKQDQKQNPINLCKC